MQRFNEWEEEEARGFQGHRAERKHGVGMVMPWNWTLVGMAHAGTTIWPGITTALEKIVVSKGAAMCSVRAAMGPRPVTCKMHNQGWELNLLQQPWLWVPLGCLVEEI